MVVGNVVLGFRGAETIMIRFRTVPEPGIHQDQILPGDVGKATYDKSSLLPEMAIRETLTNAVGQKDLAKRTLQAAPCS